MQPTPDALFPDTDPQTEAVLIGLLRQASPARKLAMVGEPNAAVRTLALAGLRRRYLHAGDPDEFWSDDETEDKGQPA